MKEQNNGGPAFPTGDFCNGMTLRDYFAAQVACGDSSNLDARFTGDIEVVLEYANRRAVVYYAIADAMLARRAK